MKTSLSFYLLAAVAGSFACSDGASPRDRNSTGGSGAQTAVGNSGAGGSSSGGAGGQGASAAGGGGGATGSNLGPALTITPGDTPATATVVDETGGTGINGGASVAKSMLGTVFNPAFVEGKLCASGSTAQVVGGDYTNYWGGLIGVDLNRVANPDAPAETADAGADAGGDGGAAAPVLGLIAQPWTPGNVVGFSFKIDGPTMPLSLRFQGTPTGSNTDMDHFCNNVTVGTAGGTFTVKFSEIVRNCYDPVPGPAMFADPAGYTQLQNINWQVSANDMIPYPFNFCVSEIKPVLGN
jgi:hypothetical protein